MEAEADWEHLDAPETYLGYARSDQRPSPGAAGRNGHRTYELPGRLRLNHWALAGTWAIEPESVVVAQPGGSIAFRFAARDAHLVLSPGARASISFRVLIDDEPPGRSHGVDVDGNGVLRDARLYQHDAVCQRTLEITFHQPGAEAYSFTFGWARSPAQPGEHMSRIQRTPRAQGRDAAVIEAHEDRGRRWYHLRPKPRRRTDVWGFNSTWWMALGWPLLVLVALFPFPWGW